MTIPATTYLHLHMGEMVPGAPYVGRRIRYGRMTAWYRRADYVSLSMAVAGRGRLRWMSPSGKTRDVELGPGTMFLLRPRDTTAVEGIADGLTLAFAAFPISDWWTIATLTSLDTRWATSPRPPMARLGADRAEAIEAFETVVARYDVGPTIFDLLQFWAVVIPKLFRTDPNPQVASPIPPWLSHAIAAMAAEHHLVGGLPHLIELTRVSPGHLAAVTRRHLDCTPTDLVATLRLRHAGNLLRSTAESVGRIAERCGFSSLHYFSARFRLAYGVSPREYRHSVAELPAIPDSDYAPELRVAPE